MDMYVQMMEDVGGNIAAACTSIKSNTSKGITLANNFRIIKERDIARGIEEAAVEV